MSSDVVEVEGGAGEYHHLDHQFTAEGVSGASRHSHRVSRSHTTTPSSFSASTHASHFGSTEWGFDLGSPGNTSSPQTELTRVPGSFGSGLPLQLIRSHQVGTPEQKETIGEETDEGLVRTTAAVALAQVSREQPAAPSSPAALTTDNDSPLTQTSLGTASAAEPAAVAATVVTVGAAASSVLSPSQKDTNKQETAAVGAWEDAALASSVFGESVKSGHSPAVKSPQPESQLDPQAPTKSTPLREPNVGRTWNKARPSRVRPTVDDGAEEKGQDRTSTTNTTFAHVEVATVAGLETTSVTAAAATDNAKPKVEEVHRERRSISEAIRTCSSMTNVVDRTAAVATAGAKKETRKQTRGTFSVRDIAASGGSSHAGPRAAWVGTSLRPALEVVPPVSLQPNAADGSMSGDGADKVNFTAIGGRRLSEPCLPIGDTFVEPEMSMGAEPATEVWERVMQNNVQDGFYVNTAATRIAMASKGSNEETSNNDEGRDLFTDMTTLVEAIDSGDPSAVGVVVDVIGDHEAAKQLSALRTNDSHQLETVVMLAALRGDVEMFHAVLRSLRRTLTEWQIADVLNARGEDGCSLLTAAAEGGNEAVFVDAPLLMGGKDKVWEALSEGEARCLMKKAVKSGNVAMFDKAKEAVLLRGKRVASLAMDANQDPYETGIVVEAAMSGSGAMIDVVVAAMSNLLNEYRVAAGVTSCAGPRRMSVLMVAAETGSLEAVTAVRNALSSISAGAKAIRNMVTAKDIHGMTALYYAANSGVVEIIRIVSELMARYLPVSKMLDVYSAALATCCVNLVTPVDNELLGAVSFLLQQGAKPGALAVTRLSANVPFPRLKESLLGAVSSARNPFVPGMNLSVVLVGAARRAVEGEKRALLSMQAAVDELLLEVLEHLPQTVRGFEGGMKACSAVFEPETVISGHKDTAGPLSVALQERQQMDTYCTIPLVLDFMWRKFTKGLPSLRDTEGVLENDKEFSNPGQTLFGDDMLANSMALLSSYGDGKLSNVTYFPGARFIIVGLLSRPDSYYKVPALRMVLDFVTYLCIMGFFAGFVLLNDEDTFDWTEIVFALYVCGAILAELRDMVERPREYILDGWNALDVTCLCLMFIGLCFRAFDPADSISSRSLYALSVPLAFTRVLFFAQILPSQGPMIQVLFSMTGELVKFGVVMLVVMGGFVVSFYSLFLPRLTFGQIWLKAFKAMLGETQFFEDISGSEFDIIATLLLVVYLMILTVMMLNLLVAVLTTAHARVDMKQDQEYKVSKARLIHYYVSVVEVDRLPSPFNILQWVLSSPMLIADWCYHTTLHKAVNRFVGRTVFWVMLGPIAVATGWLLWISSVPKTVRMVWRKSAGKSVLGKISRVTLSTASCIIVAPFWLLVLWAKGGFTGMRRVIARVRNGGGRVCCGGRDEVNTAGVSRQSSGQGLGDATRSLGDEREDVVMVVLKKAEGGLGVVELQKYLDDPMSDPDVRRDEETRATTVEHVKLLRNRLEATTKEHINELQTYLVRSAEALSRPVKHAAATTGGTISGTTGSKSGRRHLAHTFNARFSELDRELDGKAAMLEERMETIIDKRLGDLAKKVAMVIGKPPNE